MILNLYNMNKLINGFLFATLLCFGYSCTKHDNYPGPDSAFQGNVIDSVTGQNLLTETGGFQIEMLEYSWSATPDPYYIPSKPDGTFEDTRIFSGTYSVFPTQGAFWPLTDSVSMKIKGNATQNFTVVPYIEILNFTHRLSGDTLYMDFQINAPKKDGLPQIIDAWPFVNITSFVGSGATISNYTVSSGSTKNTIDINSNWDDSLATKTYELVVPGLLPGRTFYARAGVRVNDNYKQFNFSPIVEIDVPAK
jgi:hypothetical protein